MLRVLLVDDHAGTRRAIRALLVADGFEVAGEADSAVSALTGVARLAPDAVLLDVRLGSDDGYRVCRTIVSAVPHIAVVLTSSDDACHAPRLARLVGARGFVAKDCLHGADLHALFARAM